MSIEDRIRMTLGGLIFDNLLAQAEIDRLKAEAEKVEGEARDAPAPAKRDQK